ADSSLFSCPTLAISASVERLRTSPGDSQTKPRQSRNQDCGIRSRSKVIVRPGTRSPTVTDDYRGLPKGSVRPVPERIRYPLPEWEQTTQHLDAIPPAMVYPAGPGILNFFKAMLQITKIDVEGWKRAYRAVNEIKERGSET